MKSKTRLVAKAKEALERSYSPYSRFPVGAAVLDDQGRVFSGTNVENASYGLTVCAERVAIFTAIAAGAKKIEAVVVTTGAAEPTPPCGACRQVMAEFCSPATPVLFGITDGPEVETTFGQLLPFAFDASALEPKDG